MAKLSIFPTKRHTFVAVAHFATILVVILRFSFSIAIVSMVMTPISTKRSTNSSHCGNRSSPVRPFNTTWWPRSGDQPPPEFDWSESQQGLLLGGFFHGYIATFLLSLALMSRFSYKWIFGIGILLSSVLTLLTPLAARAHYLALYSVRVLLGCAQGLTFPALNGILGKWAPRNEKTKMSALIYSGMRNGSGLSLIFGGLVIWLWGWTHIFYISGGVGVLLFVVWMLAVHDSPRDHPSISEEELKYILQSQDTAASTSTDTMKSDAPWLQILRSVPVLAITVALFAHDWVFYLIVTDIPSYFRNILDIEISHNGVISGTPFIISSITQILGGYFADYIIRRGVSTTNTRKILVGLGFYPSAVCLILIGYIGCSRYALSVTYIFLALGILSLSNTSASMLDVSPRYSGVLWTITGFFANISGALAPLVTGYLTDDRPTLHYYRIVFLLAAGICGLGATFFCIFYSGEEQHWNKCGAEKPGHESGEGLLGQDGSDNVSME